MEDKAVRRIKLTFNDGTKDTLKKGFVASFQDDEEGYMNCVFSMVGINARELKLIVMSVMTLSERVGLTKQYVCPMCENEEHTADARFCKICGTRIEEEAP